MDWDAYKEFNFNSNEFNSNLGADYDKARLPDWLSGSFDKSHKTDWNKDFIKNTEEASSGKNKGLDFLKGFAKNLFGGQQGSSPYSFGGSSGGAGFSQFTPDIGVISQGGGPGQFIPGQPGWGEKLLSAGLNAATAFL